MPISRLLTVGFLAVATVSLTASPASEQTAAPAAAQNPKLEQYKRDVGLEVDGMREDIARMNDQVFSFAELGFQEFETSKYLTDILRKNGFTIQENLAGIPTAFMASWGSGKPVIALGSDIDCIPQASQKPGVAYHEAMIDGAPGHGEGHNSGMPLQIAAALAVKKIMEQQRLPGTIRLWPGVAEELVGTKAYYVRAGAFKDVDVVLFAHVSENMSVTWGDNTNNGLVSVEYTFKGESAHAAGAPWRGRSALDAVELMNIGWNFRREHLRIQQRSHYVIPNGGDQPNVVPPNATVWYYFRETDYEHIKEMWDIGNKMAQAAAMMTGTEVTSRVLGSAWPGHFNKTVAETMHANIEKVGLPEWTEAEQTLAKSLQKELKVPEIGLATKLQPLRGREVIPDEEKRGGGSDDIGDISWNVPTVTLRYPANMQAGPGPQLGERHHHGHAGRAQRRALRRQSHGVDRARSADAARARHAGVGLLQQRPDQDPEVHAADSSRGQAGHLAQRGDHGEVPGGDEEVLLRSGEAQVVSRPAGNQVPIVRTTPSQPGR